MKTKSLIAQAIIKNKVSALEISASIEDISEYCKREISGEFNRFGLKVVNFYVQSINFPDEDFDEINKILRDKASFDIIGDSRYITKRSFDTMETAAGNEGGMAGTLTGAGIGLGVGLGVGGVMGNLTSNLNTAAPASPQTKCQKCGSANLNSAVFCSECGNRLALPKIKCSKCGVELADNIKFCSSCGTPVITKLICSSCNTENDLGAKFCKDCGTRLEM